VDKTTKTADYDVFNAAGTRYFSVLKILCYMAISLAAMPIALEWF
jgi:hypothetical protein